MIRKYQPADCDDIVNVWSRASAVAHPFLSQEFLAVERYNIPNVYLPNAETWVWQSDGNIIGFISLLGNEVGAIFIDPTAHRSGIGRALIRHAQDLHGELEVEVFEKNLSGRAFYAAMGFIPFLQKVHDQTGFNVLRLRRAAEDPQRLNSTKHH
ncbi:MAG: GNAT family N-acetyltransferase [Bacteroidetes bacterium]|nr:GNAT family N-acetyltransferase [Bacteroidota bacterium]